MEEAIAEAINSREAGDYGIGAVVVKDNQIIARAGNRVKLDADPTSHAEFMAIRKATMVLGSRHLNECILYATHEPCPMCASAAIWAKMKGIVSGATIEDMFQYRQNKGNNDWSWRVIQIPAKEVLAKGDPQVKLVEEFMRKECKELFHT